MRHLLSLMTPLLVVATLFTLAPVVMAEGEESESNYYFNRFYLDSVSDKLNRNSQLTSKEERAIAKALKRTTCRTRYNLQCKNGCRAIKDAKRRTDNVVQCELVAVLLPTKVAEMWLRLLNLGKHTPDDIREIVAARLDYAQGNLDCREVPTRYSR